MAGKSNLGKKAGDSGAAVLCGLAVFIMVGGLILCAYMTSSIQPLSDSASEVVRVSAELESVSSLRSLLFSFTEQYRVTEAAFDRALGLALTFLTLGTLVVAVLSLIILSQIRRARRLARALEKSGGRSR